MKNKTDLNITSVPLEGIFTKDFASFLVNHSNTIFSTDKETDKTIARAVADGHEIPRNDPGLSRLDLKESDAINLPKLSYVKETWEFQGDSKKSALIQEYTEFLMAYRDGEEAVGFAGNKDGKAIFPSGFSGFLKHKIDKDSSRKNLDGFWSSQDENQKNSLIKKYCTKGRTAEANENASKEIAESYDGYRSKEGIARAQKAMSNAIEGVGVIKEDTKSSSWIPDLSSIASMASALFSSSLFGSAAASPTANSTRSPSENPSAEPSASPTANSTRLPSENPSAETSASPTLLPTGLPSVSPSLMPSKNPTTSPSVAPSKDPTASPSVAPSKNPTTNPTVATFKRYSMLPTRQPTYHPSLAPTSPTGLPTGQPSAYPSPEIYNPNYGKPTGQPTISIPNYGKPTGQPIISMAPTAANSQDAGLSTGAIAGMAIGGAFVLGTAIFCISKCITPSTRTNTSVGKHIQLSSTSTLIDRGA